MWAHVWRVKLSVSVPVCKYLNPLLQTCELLFNETMVTRLHTHIYTAIFVRTFNNIKHLLLTLNTFEQPPEGASGSKGRPSTPSHLRSVTQTGPHKDSNAHTALNIRSTPSNIAGAVNTSQVPPEKTESPTVWMCIYIKRQKASERVLLSERVPGLDGEVDGSSESDQVDFCLIEDGDFLIWGGGREGGGASLGHFNSQQKTTAKKAANRYALVGFIKHHGNRRASHKH